MERDRDVDMGGERERVREREREAVGLPVVRPPAPAPDHGHGHGHGHGGMPLFLPDEFDDNDADDPFSWRALPPPRPRRALPGRGRVPEMGPLDILPPPRRVRIPEMGPLDLEAPPRRLRVPSIGPLDLEVPPGIRAPLELPQPPAVRLPPAVQVYPAEWPPPAAPAPAPVVIQEPVPVAVDPPEIMRDDLPAHMVDAQPVEADEIPYDVYVAQVLEIIPDVLPAHVVSLIDQHHPSFGDKVAEAVLHTLFENPDYPRAEAKGMGKGKRKREDDEEELPQRAVRPKIDYGDKNRRREGSHQYVNLALVGVCFFVLWTYLELTGRRGHRSNSITTSSSCLLRIFDSSSA